MFTFECFRKLEKKKTSKWKAEKESLLEPLKPVFVEQLVFQEEN